MCGPVLDGVTEYSANASRERTRSRRRFCFYFKYVYNNSLSIYNAFRHGRSDPIRLVAQEMAPILAAAKSGGAY